MVNRNSKSTRLMANSKPCSPKADPKDEQIELDSIGIIEAKQTPSTQTTNAADTSGRPRG
jgi:hypothetical protein